MHGNNAFNRKVLIKDLSVCMSLHLLLILGLLRSHSTVLSTNRPPVAIHLMRLINYLVTATTGYCISTNKVTF